jgi:acetyl esterase/lipase
MSQKIILDPAAQKFADDTAKPPYLFDLGPEKGRETVDKVQSGPVEMPEVEIKDLVIEGGPSGKITLRIVRPPHADGPLPVILYLHGAGWVFGNVRTHDRLVRELAVGAQAVVVFVEYSLAPETKYPTALEECYAALEWVSRQTAEDGFDAKRIAVVGDSVGGNLSIAVTLLTKERSGPKITQQLLFYPVTNAAFDTASYQQFAEGYFLRRDAMQWFWDQYTTGAQDRERITASPLRATVEQLKGLPRALVITAEADVLRDEGEAYANKLREAGVDVAAARFQGTIHDFVMLNALADTAAAHGALALATAWLWEGFES